MDEMVLRSQQWMNRNYGNDYRYNVVEEDGQTGWGTIYGLIRAFQIELGIEETADAFGPTTRRLMEERYPGGIQQQNDNDKAEDRVYGIIQCALWCKGYSTGSSDITEHFYAGTGLGVRQLKTDMGLGNSSSTITVNIMEALLSMKQYVIVSGGSSIIRSIQQELNGSYEAYVGLIPCDGLYGREMNDALIKVLQAIEGFTPDEATGNFGEGTKSRCPILPDTDMSLPTEERFAATKLLKYALSCNGYPIADLGVGWTQEVRTQLMAFQEEYCLEADGIAGLNTWMALLLSCGNPDRSAEACDCATILNLDKAKALYRAGYRYVGRYLTGGVGVGESARSKAMTKAELDAVFEAGLRIFAIYQDNDPVVEYYTEIQGEIDCVNAVNAARKLGIPEGTHIYFAVDCDMMDYQVTSNAIPYFRGIRKMMKELKSLYKVGIYGSRNICTRVSNEGFAKRSFVADMSTGYSGNMGFPIPSNWAFDQFNEYLFTGASEDFALDKDAFSGRDFGFGVVTEYPEDYEPVPTEDLFKDRAEFLLKKMGINMKTNIAFGEKVIVADYFGGGGLPHITIEYYIYNEEKKLEGNVGTIHIVNGEKAEITQALLDNNYGKLSEEVQALISEDGTLGLTAGIEQEIGNGSIAFEYGFEGKSITMTFMINEKLWEVKDGENTLAIQINIKIDEWDAYKKEFATLRELVNAQSTAVMQSNCFYVVCALLTAGGLGYALTAIEWGSIATTIVKVAYEVSTKLQLT